MSNITYRPIKQTEYKRLAEVSLRAFGQAASRTATTVERAGFRSYSSVGAFADVLGEETLVGTAVAYDQDLSIPGGKIAPAAGISMVSVDPTHRRQGISKKMMLNLLNTVRDQGDVFATLFATEAMIYPRYGFGPATRRVNYTIDLPHALDSIPELNSTTLTFTRVPINAAYPLVNKIYTERMATRSGMLVRDVRWWGDRILNKAAFKSALAELLCVVAYRGTDPVAYCLYGFNAQDATGPNHIVINELMGADLQAEILMHRWMFQHDLVSKITYNNGDPQMTWRFALVNPDTIKTSRFQDGLWVRILDVQQALTLRGYGFATEFSLRIHDHMFPENDGLWHIDTSGAEPLVVRLDDDAPVDLELTMRELSEIFLGETSIHQLIAVNRITVHNPTMVHSIHLALSTPERPWSPEVF